MVYYYTGGGFYGKADDKEGTKVVKELAHTHMIETERTKRLLIAAVTGLFICSALVMVFAPSGREQAGYIMGAVLIVLALGAIGASKFLLKMPGIQLDTKDRSSPEEGQKAPPGPPVGEPSG